jgi:hypothetical protein
MVQIKVNLKHSVEEKKIFFIRNVILLKNALNGKTERTEEFI